MWKYRTPKYTNVLWPRRKVFDVYKIYKTQTPLPGLPDLDIYILIHAKNQSIWQNSVYRVTSTFISSEIDKRKSNEVDNDENDEVEVENNENEEQLLNLNYNLYETEYSDR
ncbi:hypothetical protein RCL_jg11799.t1 [Rhizophagus clarus]|uniref:Uncharacterized protein n=1 Tax=Rhizophagus clarus TaxID=94130 RepID=A0A8H3M8S3_9GLOM|nr:hypothetical protein RCL_jg11799.t1 [Rhizophagus clarus]